MKTLVAAILILPIVNIQSFAQANLHLTNDVPIVDYGMRLALCDNFFERGDSLPLSDVSDLHAEKELTWMLHNPSSNTLSVIYIGSEHSFDLKMFNTNGVEISKTSKGKAMSVGPTSLTNPSRDHATRLGGGALQVGTHQILFPTS